MSADGAVPAGDRDGGAIDYTVAVARRRQLIDCYYRVRSAADPRIAWEMWRGEMALVRMPAGGRPAALPAFAYDPAWRGAGEFTPTAPLLVAADPVTVLRIGTITLDVPSTEEVDLEVYWIDGYPGGMLLPFADPTNGETTAARGRLLIDQAAGADLGVDFGGEGERWVLDFNFAYDPTRDGASPAPVPAVTSPNRLPVPVQAGERLR